MKHIWFPLYDGDLVKDTMDLSAIEFGIYVRLIVHAYNHHGEIPTKVVKLAHITGCERRLWWRFGAPVLKQFFIPTVDGSTMTHKRVLSELHRSAELSSKRSAAGRASAEQRRSKRATNGEVNTTQHKDKKEPVTGSRYNSSTGTGLSLAEQDRLIADYEKRTGKPWQQTRQQHDGISPEKTEKNVAENKEGPSEELEAVIHAKGWK
jgi:uncharacterized protein YdaU (DUF1376 family)